MTFVNLASEVPEREMIPGYKARLVHSQNMTFAYWTIARGAQLPEHCHRHEQVAHMLEGEFELTIAGDTKVLTQGMVAIVAPDAVHSGRALTDCRILDVFSPVREDYR